MPQIDYRHDIQRGGSITIQGNELNSVIVDELEPMDNSIRESMLEYDSRMISMIRRVMPTMTAYDLVGVQPMSGPTGTIFHMDTNRRSRPRRGIRGMICESRTSLWR